MVKLARHHGVCLGVDDVAFHEKAGYLEVELPPVKGGAEGTDECAFALMAWPSTRRMSGAV